MIALPADLQTAETFGDFTFRACLPQNFAPSRESKPMKDSREDAKARRNVETGPGLLDSVYEIITPRLAPELWRIHHEGRHPAYFQQPPKLRVFAPSRESKPMKDSREDAKARRNVETGPGLLDSVYEIITPRLAPELWRIHHEGRHPTYFQQPPKLRVFAPSREPKPMKLHKEEEHERR